MIKGIGTDICDIRRIESILEKYGDRFKEKTFTAGEREYADAQANPAASYAKRFAAKEAVAKALAGSKTGSLSWQDVEVVKNRSGRPKIKLHGAAKTRAKSRLKKGQKYRVHISLSDDIPYAQAFAVFEAR
ncbi:MAG: holo-[acyl-carrier-protein] synthase [Acidimicrobiales bacterium]|nr:holo-ACP synthase [Hyphomonadaceae bacterium]RZV42806.1 MAG: holo-[acyl-carrier-protein] synthase [Acidimicrobiales bacterium]